MFEVFLAGLAFCVGWATRMAVEKDYTLWLLRSADGHPRQPNESLKDWAARISGTF